MRQFDIAIKQEINELAKVTEILARHGVNIMAISMSGKDVPSIKVVTNDERSTRSALQSAGLSFKETEILSVSMMDRPGELSKVARKLVKAGVTVEAVYILGKTEGKTILALGVDKQERAKEVLNL